MQTTHIDPQVLAHRRLSLQSFLDRLKMADMETAIALEERASHIRQKLAAQWKAENPS